VSSAADAAALVLSLARPSAGQSGATRHKTAHARKPDSTKTSKPTPPKPTPVWPVAGPEPLPGSILPVNRIVAFYGNPLSRRMGVLGALPPDRMLVKLDSEVARWREADPATPVIPALQL